MPRHATPLTAKAVTSRPPGRYADGNKLHLLVKPTGARSWVFRYVFEGKRFDMGVGPAGNDPAAVTLAEARDLAGLFCRQLREGINPGTRRKAEKEQLRVAVQIAPEAKRLFRDVAGLYMAIHEKAWRNEKHVAQWTSTLTTYAYPHFGDVPVEKVTTDHVLSALTPIWNKKPETASRVRGRIESVLGYAKSRGWRTGDNPAQWRGHLQSTLPAPSKLRVVRHHPALPWKVVAAFMVELRKHDSVGALALELTILCVTRTGEALGARWQEIDLAEKIWTIPGVRMKAKRDHRIPLSEAALIVLQKAAALRTSDSLDIAVFPGKREGTSLSLMAMAMLLRRMNQKDVTVHGFRSTFRDWAAESTTFDRDTAEAALAHVVKDKTEAAYRRGDQLEKRRRLMDAWAEYCARSVSTIGNVVAIRAAG